MKTLVSIIIPCYNSAATVEETLRSVVNQSFEGWEAIIVNDGSPDHIEEIAKKWVELDPRFRYFRKENGGLATARNYGIQRASGKYILPLDSDNKVLPTFISSAIKVLESNHLIDILYGNAIYFGEKSGDWIVGQFDKKRMLESNYIDACAIIKRELFVKTGYYDDKMPFQGVEDWEFWIRQVKNKSKFHYLNSPTFEYRVTGDSMIRSFSQEMTLKNIYYISNKHFWFLFKSSLKEESIYKIIKGALGLFRRTVNHYLNN